MRTIGEEAKHVGAWETNEGYVCFGSWQAVRAFYLHAQEAALVSPAQAPASTEPVAQWQTSATGDGGWMNIDADEVEFCRTTRGYKVRALIVKEQA